jgi:hypothetical protein
LGCAFDQGFPARAANAEQGAGDCDYRINE